MRPARSLLIVQARRLELLEHRSAAMADAVVVDFTMALPDPDQARVTAAVQDRLAREPERRWWLRLSLRSPSLEKDLDLAFGAGNIEGVVLPGVRSAADVAGVGERIAALERQHGVADGRTALIIQLDNAKAVLFAHELAVASPRVASLCFDGSEHGGLVADLACAWSIEGPELIYARQYALVAARAAGMGCPLDGPFANVEDLGGLAHDTELSRRLGYRGRVVVDPGQIEIVNRIYSPTTEEVDYHRRVLETLDAAIAEGRASVTLDGKMIDYAHAATARAVIAQARELGVVP